MSTHLPGAANGTLPLSGGRYRRHRELVVLFLPTLLFFLVFKYLPMAGLIIAFKQYIMSEGVLRSPWIGFENFARLFYTGDFTRAVRNTLIISILRLSFGFVAPIVLALALNEVRIAWFRRGIQTLTYLPYFFSWVILGGIFLMLFRGDGPINSLLTWVGGHAVSFLG
ncbi:MAG: sugar ABC transporter permease, partial [Phycisphaerae bacterium]